VKSILEWLKDRFPIDSVIEFANKKRVPVFYGSMWYFLGGISLFLFIIQVITGILLVLYYQPGESTSFESVKFIVSKVEFGWLIREIHAWSANLFIFFVFSHMFTVFFAKAYRKPREMTWYTGMVLLFISLIFGFSGYLLPWNELAYFATKVGTDIAGVVPWVGDFMLKLLRSGDEVRTRFYGIHTAVLPLIFTMFLVVHLAFIQIQGMSVPPELENLPEEKRKSIPFFPDFVMHDLIIWMVVLNIIALLAVFFPWELGEKADSLASAPAGIRPEWYFIFMFETLKLVFMFGGLIWFFVPILDRKAIIGVRSRFWSIFGIGLIIYMVGMTIWGYIQ